MCGKCLISAWPADLLVEAFIHLTTLGLGKQHIQEMPAFPETLSNTMYYTIYNSMLPDTDSLSILRAQTYAETFKCLFVQATLLVKILLKFSA